MLQFPRPTGRALAVVVVAVAASGCGGGGEPAPTAPEAAATSASPAPEETRAVAELEGRSGQSVTGTVTFTQRGDEPTRVDVLVEGASPGLHGIHVHETGDCSAPDAQSAGGHFNPGGAPHGAPTASPRHAGDLGNVEVREGGTGDMAVTSDLLTVGEGPASVVGRAVVVHADEDDLTSQPAGNSGARIACGVVVAEPGA